MVASQVHILDYIDFEFFDYRFQAFWGIRLVGDKVRGCCWSAPYRNGPLCKESTGHRLGDSFHMGPVMPSSQISLDMRLVKERRRYIVTTFLIGWAHT